jgi:DNA-binding NarL/FixJ family response regulator
MNPQKIRIAVVDDHALFRAGLISLLSSMSDFQVVGEGGNGLEALDIINETNADVLLLDVTMPVMDGVTTVRKLKQISNVRIIMLTISRRQEDLIGAIQAGADGYLLKNSEPEELQKAIRLTFEGKSILSPDVTSQVMQTVRLGPQESPDRFMITKREMDVLKLLSQGMTNPQISKNLHISENTVKTHVRNLMEKLEAANRVEAVSIAIKNGVIGSDT